MFEEKQKEIIDEVVKEIKKELNIEEVKLGDIFFGSEKTDVYLIVPSKHVDSEELENIIADKGMEILENYGHLIMFYAREFKNVKIVNSGSNIAN